MRRLRGIFTSSFSGTTFSPTTGSEIVEAALPAIVDSLVPGGFLVIGRKEHLPGFLKGFHPLPEVSCMYRAGR